MGGEGNASPEQVAFWESEPLLPPESYADKFRSITNYFGAGPRVWLKGNYSYKYLCMPTFWPWKSSGYQEPPFFAVDEQLPLSIALVMGIQHALAMIGGLIVPPLIIGSLSGDPSTQRFLVTSAIICSGIFTLIHVIQLPLYKNTVLGSGILSCTGVSFTFLTPTQSAIQTMMSQGDSFDRAYGRCLGTLMVCSVVVILMSFIPSRVLRRVFPPIVPGVVIFMIGASLIKSAFLNWGGGSSCQGKTIGCVGNGQVRLPFGSPEYIGLGFAAFMILLLLELFGSPFLRNSMIIIALLCGYLIAGVTKHAGKSYVDLTNIRRSPGGTFLWTRTFPIGFYAPIVLPYLVGMIVLGVEVIGDVTATAEVSHIETAGPKQRRRIKGALLADGINTLLAACAMTLPVTTFAQNNGVINITRCSSRIAGICCGIWLILFGIIAKIGAFFTSIPNCVLGGVTCFLFANVAVSGIKIIVLGDLQRRNRFILSMALALGLGVTLVPDFADARLWPVSRGMSSGVRGFRDACIIVLHGGYSIGFLTTVILNLILPMEQSVQDISDVKTGLYTKTPRHNEMQMTLDHMNGGNGKHTDDTAHPHKAPALQDPPTKFGEV